MHFPVAKDHQNKVDDNTNSNQGTVFLKAITNKDDLQKNLKKARAALDEIDAKGIWGPSLANNFVFENNKVLKVKLKTYFGDCSIPLKYYPSWSMLGLKASANWLVFAEQLNRRSSQFVLSKSVVATATKALLAVVFCLRSPMRTL